MDLSDGDDAGFDSDDQAMQYNPRRGNSGRGSGRGSGGDRNFSGKFGFKKAVNSNWNIDSRGMRSHSKQMGGDPWFDNNDDAPGADIAYFKKVDA